MASSCAMYDLGTSSSCNGALRKVACRSLGRASNGFHGARRWTLPAGGQKGVSPRRNAYDALLRSCIGSCMIWVSRWFLRAYTSSPI